MVATEEELKKYYEIRKSMDDATDVCVKISLEQAHMITIASLIRKYKNTRNSFLRESLYAVLTQYFVSDDELQQFLEQEE